MAEIITTIPNYDTRLITPLSFKVRENVQFFTQDYFNGITLDEWAKSQTKITLIAQNLIVEDEGIIAKDIQNTLEGLGYAVLG